MPHFLRSLVLFCVTGLAAPAMATVSTGVERWQAGDWSAAVAEWVTPAARGDADALFNMGQAYRLGRGVAQSSTTALDYYRRAADKGHVAATANLGITLWQEGRRTEALGHLRTAADRGDLRAAYVLGVATFTGDGAPRNPALGYAYIVRARDGGLAVASGQAARFATRLTAEERARGEAAAAALAAGRPVAVAMADPAGPDRPIVPDQTAQLVSDAEEESDSPPEPVRRDRRAGAGTTVATKTDAKAASGTGERAEGTSRDDDAGGFRVQLGAYANERAARTAWATLVSQSAALLKGLKPVYSPRGGLVRLQVGPFDGKPEAGALCAKLSAGGRPCFVTSS
jgi:hypothetical protein